jgi:hypothetical protein
MLAFKLTVFWHAVEEESAAIVVRLALLVIVLEYLGVALRVQLIVDKEFAEQLLQAHHPVGQRPALVES